MTTALCLYCGETKFGAFNPCPSCDAPATGNHNLDIAFSDHRVPVAGLEKLGDVIRAINAVTVNRDVRFWSFISYISGNHDELLTAEPAPEIKVQVDRILRSISHRSS